MTRINLLPWRDELRKKKQEEFIVSLITTAVIAIAIILGLQMYLGGMISEQKEKHDIVTKKISELQLITAKIKNIQAQNAILQSKRDAIQKLQKSRPEIVHFFDEIAKVTPDGVFLTQLKQERSRIVLKGKTESNARVSAFMRNVEGSPWLFDPELNVIKGRSKNTKDELSEFTLHAKQLGSKSQDEDI